ncbi:MAG: 1,4-alpha-glucan branching protein GlgB, partial [Gemmatimonadaceae bacterium]|nr:1,4-alpha-glucan branching protein GlgB [Gemmatimonadaceae bacterium]
MSRQTDAPTPAPAAAVARATEAAAPGDVLPGAEPPNVIRATEADVPEDMLPRGPSAAPVPADIPAPADEPVLADIPAAPDDLVVGAPPAEPEPLPALAVPPAHARPRIDPRHPLGALDFHLFAEGTHLRLWEHMGAIVDPTGEGVHFALWAPNARAVSVIGDWNGWDPSRDRLRPNPGGVWTGFVAGARRGSFYKYQLAGPRGEVFDKADPHALLAEMPPQTASVVWDLEHTWHDGAWMARRAERQAPGAPLSIYEVHLGSWLRGPDGEHLNYRDIAPKLVEHVTRLGFTHVELMPITEHPFYGSWGYQASAYFAPTRRYGRPQDLMALIDALHQAGIGVLLDWVPAHFPGDAHGLARFDGTSLYEHADPRRGLHPDWNTLIFNLSRHEVRSFLLSSAMMWLQAYHIDGLRVDAVASMLYLDYSRKEGQWVPNHHGGRENLEAIHFLRELNRAVHREVPGAITIAEESTAWPLVSHPVEAGGLGFDFKWDMGWMHDTLRYCGRDPLFRCQHHRDITFRMMYAYSERFVLPLSHDEVVHGKGSLPIKMAPGTGGGAQRLATLRLLYAYMFGLPGKKLLFMGGEFGQVREWNHDRALDWDLLEEPGHAGLMAWTARLGHLLRDEPALHQLDHDPTGFRWAVVDDELRSTIAFVRRP